MTEAYPLQWPDGWPRIPAHEQDAGYQFKKTDSNSTWGGKRLVTFSEARDKLYDELQRLGAVSAIVSSNHPPGRYGIPVEAKRQPTDQAIAVYFAYNGKPMVMACDRFQTTAGNMRSLGLAIEAMRQLERHGGGTMIEKAFTGFVALPAPRSPHDVLGVSPHASSEEVEAAFRTKAKLAHPDAGGSASAMAELTEARRKLKERAA